MKRNRTFEEIEREKQEELAKLQEAEKAKAPKKRKTPLKTPSVALPRIFKYRLKPKFRIALLIIFLAVLFISVSSYQASQICKELEVNVISGENNAFLTTKQIGKIIEEGYQKPVIGVGMTTIDLRQVEEALKKSPYIKDAQVAKTFRSKLHIEVTLREPIARVVNMDGTSLYIDKEGIKFPTANRHSSNVPLIRGQFSETVEPMDTFRCELIRNAVPVAQFIEKDKFWKAQISEIYITQANELMFYPQISTMYIEFGEPKRIEEKFENMRIFYDQVIKEVGWNKYKGFSVKYRGQIIGKRS